MRNGLARLPSRLERDAEWLEVKTELARAQRAKSKTAINAAEERSVRLPNPIVTTLQS